LADEMWKMLENLQVSKIFYNKEVISSDGVWTSTRVRLMWTRVDRRRRGQKPDFHVDVING